MADRDARAMRSIKRWEMRKGERGTFESHWQEIANLMQPDRADYLVKRSPGMKRMESVFDSTPIWAIEMLASGLHSLLVSPYLRWFTLQTESNGLNRQDSVLLWLEAASDAMYSIFNSARHNFAAQSYELFVDQAGPGTACMGVLESPRSGILFSTRPLQEVVIGENEEDRVDSVTRQWTYTAGQAWDAWGKAAGPSVEKAMADGKEDAPFTFLHDVGPRRDRDPQRRDRKNKPFQSLYVSLDDGTVIGDEGGFDEFPFLVPRFRKNASETWGRSPSTTALPDVKMLNELMRMVLKGAQKLIDPPLQMPDAGFLMPIKTYPGSLNYYRAGSRDRIEPIETKGQPQLGLDMIQALRQQILKTFYVEWLVMPSDMTDPASSGKGVTATWVLQQRDEKMRMLSPMLARQQLEFLGPLIDRVFAILWRKSIALRFGPGSPFPPPPPELSGVPLRVEYVSPIAVAQKTSEMDSTNRLIQLATSLVPICPQVGGLLDSEAILRTGGRILNAPPALIKSPEQIQQETQAAAQAQAQMNAHAQVANLAGAAQDATGALKNLSQAGIGAGGQQAQGAPGAQQSEAA